MEKPLLALATIVVVLCLLMMLATAEESQESNEPHSFPTPYLLGSPGIINIADYYNISEGDKITCKKGNGYLLMVSFHLEDGGDFRIYKIMESGEKEFVSYIPGFLIEDRNENGELIYSWEGKTKQIFIYGADRPLNEKLDLDFSIKGQARTWNTKKPFPRGGTIADYFSWRDLYPEEGEWGPCD